MKNQKHGRYVLGLDIGTNSIGWAILEVEVSGKDGRLKPLGVKRTGARVFEAGVEGDIESGKEESRNVKRREARLHRRQLYRRARRMRKLFSILQGEGFLPEEKRDSPEALHKFFEDFDKNTRSRYVNGNTGDTKRTKAHVVPYLLRACALDEKLPPHELGRALYHLAQRRGFLSNRKAPQKKDEDKSKVKEGIFKLENEMEEANARTLGEYFSKLDPEDNRIRGRWTARQMYEDEFELIWKAQKNYHPDLLTDELKSKIHNAIFHQRPLKSQKHLVGKCAHEPDRPRAPWAILDAQRFRMIQMLNNAEIYTPDGRRRLLELDERNKLIETLQIKGDRTFKQAKKIIGVSEDHKFNFETGGEKRFIGNHTAAKLIKIFGEKRWRDFSEQQRNQIIDDALSIHKEEALERRGIKAWGLDEEKARDFGELKLEEGHCHLSRTALAKLLPIMEGGIPYRTAVSDVYGDQPLPEPVDTLPPVNEAISELRNPVVNRTLSELRKVVNAIVHEYGKPEMIRIEMIRDIKKSRKQREQTWKKNRRNQKEREEAAKEIAKEIGIEYPSRDNILKYQLAVECDWKCPYTGTGISMTNLYRSSQFDIEHIIPFSRCLDNTFVNKTLCYHEENRNVKRNRTPFEAYGNSPKWDEILQRVKDFRSSPAHEKLRRFKLTPDEVEKEFEEFTERQIRDTSYAARLAVGYLGLLYGGDIDESGRRRIQPGRGRVTSFLRNEWRLNGILGDGGEKSRDDHRHHAVDAVAIALTDPGTTKMLSDAARRAPKERRRLFGKVPPPWEGFLEDVRESINNIVVSHRVSRKVSGPLHEETHYSPPKKDENGKIYHVVRKRLEMLSKSDINDIVDTAVRDIVIAKFEELGGEDPKKAFADTSNHPYLQAKNGRKIPIHKVRIKRKISAKEIGKGPTERHVLTGSNHHVEILEVKDKKGGIKWEGEVVTRYEAMRRLRAGEPIIKRDHGEGKEFKFSLGHGESIRMKDENGKLEFYTVSKFSKSASGRVTLHFTKHTDARPKGKGVYVQKDPEPLRKAGCEKIVITPLGEVRRAND